jgi:hypothetical protein
LNPGRRGGKPATNRFSYGAAEPYTYCYNVQIGNNNKQLRSYNVIQLIAF